MFSSTCVTVTNRLAFSETTQALVVFVFSQYEAVPGAAVQHVLAVFRTAAGNLTHTDVLCDGTGRVPLQLIPFCNQRSFHSRIKKWEIFQIKRGRKR